MQRRLPKRGFRNSMADKIALVNVGDLEAFDAGAEITLEMLRSQKLLRGQFDGLKILGDGEISKALTVHAHSFSKSAAAKIEKAGGKAVVVQRPKKAEKPETPSKS